MHAPLPLPPSTAPAFVCTIGCEGEAVMGSVNSVGDRPEVNTSKQGERLLVWCNQQDDWRRLQEGLAL